jgi:hypothetical protein
MEGLYKLGNLSKLGSIFLMWLLTLNLNNSAVERMAYITRIFIRVMKDPVSVCSEITGRKTDSRTFITMVCLGVTFEMELPMAVVSQFSNQGT